MKKRYQVFLLVQVAVMLTILLTIMAPIQAEETEQVKNCFQCEMELRNELKVHLDFYYEMLVNRYAPNELEHWRKVRGERDLVQKKLSEHKRNGKLQSTGVMEEEWIKTHRDIQNRFKMAVEKRNEDQLRVLLPIIVEHDEKLNKIYKQQLKQLQSS
ncbi:hypothetical protein GN156_02090 [bacterium LRH843]|nr:hypothetical protein [bacterium LRH843]